MNSSTGTSMMNTSSSTPSKAKRVAKKTDEPVAASVPVVPVAAVAADAKKVGRKPAVVAPVSTPVSAPAPSTVPATPEAAAVVAPAGPTTTLDDDLKSVLTTLTTLRETVSTMITEVKRLDKRVHREIKDARKRKRRVRAEGEEAPKRGPSIFEIPTKVTEELCIFLGKPKGTLISRSNVTKEVNNYVKAHDLKNKHDIKPDAALKKLLQVPDTEQLTYFNLQRYLNRHYIKEPKVVVA